MASKLLVLGAVFAVPVAVLVGLLLSPIPGKSGFYKWLTSLDPRLVGAAPAFVAREDWGYTFEQLSKHDLTGQRAIVTGGNSGTGFATALELAKLNAIVTIACRNTTKCQAAAEDIRSQTGSSNVNSMTMDTSSLKSVRKFATTYMQANDSLDMLFLNAGIVSAGANEDGSAPLSEDGIELVFATNHVGHHLLFRILEPLLLQAPMARIVLTSSGSSYHTFEYKVATDIETLNKVQPLNDFMKIYGQSKLAQIMFAKELARRQGPNSTIYVNACHPGVVNTPILDKNPMVTIFLRSLIDVSRERFMWNQRDGALTMLYLGVATDELKEKEIRGKYFHPQVQELINPLAEDQELYGRVWDFSNELVRDFV